MITDAPDRRAALKARHRAAILQAARELVSEREGARFGVDDVATRADVARRTVFNHFATLDDVLLTLCDEVLEVVIDDFIATVAARPVGDDSAASMFDEIAASMLLTDLPTAIAKLSRILGAPGSDESREKELSDRAFARAADRLMREVQRRHPAIAPFDVELLVGGLMNGVLVVAKYVVTPLDAPIDDESGRAVWQAALTHHIETMRNGYLPTTARNAAQKRNR